MKLWEYIKDNMMKNPNQTICENDAEMTYEDIVVYAEAFAERISMEKCCAIFCGSEMAASMALLACFAEGVTAVPLSTRYGEKHCNKIMDMISPTAIITDVNGELQVIRLSYSEYKASDENPALIMCTSGTTGKPKGAMLGEKNIYTNVNDIVKYFDIDSDDRILIARPLYHCAVLTGEFLTSLIKGVNIRFYSEQFNPPVLLDIILKHNITVFCGTPTLFDAMSRFKRKDARLPLKTICISGECLSKDIALRIEKSFYGAKIYHVYGLTEACPRIAYLPPERFSECSDFVGVPLKSVSVKIIKDDGGEATKNEEGVLWVSGDNIMIGYYNDPEQTNKVKKNGWLSTGDIATINSEGFIKIKGRSDDLIIRAGMNIYPQEIESALKKDSRVKDVLVYSKYNPISGVQVAMKMSGDFSNVEEVRELCKESLPTFQIPSFIELLEELPKNGSGKIIRGGQNA